MQWSVLSESTIIHQALQIVPVLSWRGSRCAQIMSLTPSVWGVNRGGEVRHGALSSSKRKRFIDNRQFIDKQHNFHKKRHNHFIDSLNSLLSAHFACLSFYLLPSFIFLVTRAFCHIILCLPPFSIILSLFLFCLFYVLSLWSIYHLSVSLFFPLSRFPSRHVWLPFWFSEQHYTDCSVTDTRAPALRSPFPTLVCIYSSCMKNITLHGS